MSEEQKTYKCSEVIDTCKWSWSDRNCGRCCDYLSKAGERRGCPAEECTKYEKRKE